MFRERASELQPRLVDLRRALHRQPELGLELPRTQQRVLVALQDLPLEVTVGRELSSVIAVLRGRGSRDRDQGPSVLLRADMDALPVSEMTELPFASAVAGRMHACGHDLHTAMLVGAAQLLSASRDELSGDVVFMFQPGEEIHEGAELMIEEGILEAAGSQPASAFAIHVVANMPRGLFSSRRGTILASADVFDVTVRGTGGHASFPHRAADPLPAACEMVTALQTYVARRCNVFDPVVVTVGRFNAGSASNVIPTEATFVATVRTLTTEARDRVKPGLMKLVEGIASAHGLEVTAAFSGGHPLTANDPEEAEFAEATIQRVYGATRFAWAAQPVMAAEDFSHILARIPGAMIFLGACSATRDVNQAALNHAPDAIFDDTILADGAVLLAELAIRRLRSRTSN